MEPEGLLEHAQIHKNLPTGSNFGQDTPTHTPHNFHYLFFTLPTHLHLHCPLSFLTKIFCISISRNASHKPLK